jgi:hypothetical protein
VRVSRYNIYFHQPVHYRYRILSQASISRIADLKFGDPSSIGMELGKSARRANECRQCGQQPRKKWGQLPDDHG